MLFKDFAEVVAMTPEPHDVHMTERCTWKVSGDQLYLDELPASMLAAYQMKSATKAPIDLRSFASLDTEDQQLIADQLTSATRRHNHETHPLVMRVAEAKVGGIVSSKYDSIPHSKLVDLMSQNVTFETAEIHKYAFDNGRMDATMLIDGEWAVDGGIKMGIRLKNGVFGDYSYGWTAMLFHLKCTNGMMDVLSSENIFKRHFKADGTDIAADLVAAMKRGDIMFDRSRQSAATVIDINDTLIDLHRRSLLSRGQLAKTIAQIEDLGGVAGEQSTATVWGLSQAITAAAREYSFVSYDKMGKLAGRLVVEGYEQVLKSSPIKVNAPTYESVKEEFFRG